MKQKIEYGASTSQLAAVDLDWSLINAQTIYKCIYPLLIKTDNLISVKIFKTVYGKEKLEYEEIYGPQFIKQNEENFDKENINNENRSKESEENIEQEENIGKSISKDANSSNKEEKNTAEKKEKNLENFEEKKNFIEGFGKLRYNQKIRKISPLECNIINYKLQSRKYHIAIIEFKMQSEAENIYECLDGMEIEDTNNYFDLRFVNNHKVCDLVDDCFEYDESEPIFKRCKDNDIEWENDGKRTTFLESLFDQDEIDSETINDLIDVSGEENEQIKNKKKYKKNLIEKNEKVMSDSNKKDKKRKTTKADLEKMIKDKPEEKEINLDLNDQRFAEIFENDDFNIDVTNKLYKNNAGLKEIVKRKREKYNKED